MLDDQTTALVFVACVLVAGLGFGLFTSYKISKKNKANKKLSKKQKREREL